MNEQLSLFEETGITKEELAERICAEFNKLDTVWKGTFRVKKIELERWKHISDPDKTLDILINAEVSKGKYLMYFEGDEESQQKVLCIGDYSPLVARLLKDKDFTFNPTPWFILFIWHKFEHKDLDKILGGMKCR